MQLHHALRLAPDELSVVTLVGAGGKTSALFRLADEAVAAGRRAVTTTTTHIFAAQAEQAPARLEVKPDAADPIDWAALEAQLARRGHCLIWSPPRVRSAGAGGVPAGPPLTGSKRQGLPPQIVDALAARAGDLGISLIAIEGDGSRRRPVKAPAPHEPVIPSCTTHLVPVAGLDGLGLPLDGPYVHRPEQVRALLQEEDPSTRLTPRMLGRLLVEPYERGARSGERGERTPLGSASRPPGASLAPLLNKADSAPRLAAARLIAQRLAQQNQPALIGAVGAESRTPVRERWGPAAAVVLAAGESRRMGQPKQLLRWQGEPLVTRAARIALDSGASETIVVTGAVAEQVEAALAPLRAAGRGRLRVVFNPAWQDGQAGSACAPRLTRCRLCRLHVRPSCFCPWTSPVCLRRSCGGCGRRGAAAAIWRLSLWMGRYAARLRSLTVVISASCREFRAIAAAARSCGNMQRMSRRSRRRANGWPMWTRRRTGGLLSTRSPELHP